MLAVDGGGARPAGGAPGGGATTGPVVPLEAAALAVLGAFTAGGAGGQSPEEIVRDVDSRSLVQVLAKRSRRRVIRALPWRR